jgi:hypothetical protein
MRRTLAVVLLVGLSVSIADADDTATAKASTGVSVTLTPESELLLAKVAGARPQKVGILTYYPNQGGGYTFLEGKEIAFYALPYLPSTHHVVQIRFVTKNRIVLTVNISAVDKLKMQFGSQTFYGLGMTHKSPTTFLGIKAAQLWREDVSIAKWSRETPDGTFRLSIMAQDNETRLKLKSIVPVLEHAEPAR